MNATTNIICYKQKILANGENPIMITIQSMLLLGRDFNTFNASPV